MGSHKTKNQLEIELNELKQLYGEKCSECDFLKKDNLAKSEAVTNACADLKNTRKDLEDARAELKALKEGNKKLADQFYDYRTELVKVRKELADAIENRDSLKVELEGVRGALKRESELRVDTEKKRDEYKQEMVKWKNEAGQYHIWWEGVCKDNELLRNFKEDVEKIMQKYCILSMDSLDNQLRHWKYTDNKLSHDLCMPLESLIHMLDEYDVNDFCKLRERLMYGPTTAYSNALAQVRKLEKENMDLKAVADDLEKQRREAVQNFEKAARRNDELQNEVNKLQQRWTDEFNPEDEMLGRKVLEWQQINAILAKHNIENAMVLESELDMLKEYRKVLDKHGVMGPPYLDKRLSQSCPEKYMEIFRKYGIDSAEGLDELLKHHVDLLKEISDVKWHLPALVHLARIFNG